MYKHDSKKYSPQSSQYIREAVRIVMGLHGKVLIAKGL